MNVLICGGGTAGHVNPGVAIADALIKKSTSVAFVGRLGADEYRLIEERSIPLYRLKAQGLDRHSVIKSVKAVSTLAKSVFEAKKIIKSFSADVVVATGGYVCAPLVIGARLLRIPTVLHESNAYPGLTTRRLSSMCERVLLNFEECGKYLSHKGNIRVVGNPLLFDFEKMTREDARRKLGMGKNDYFILSFGGSGGAQELNDTVIALMKSYSLKNPSIKHVHAVGKKYYARIEDVERELCRGARGCKILPYIENMPTLMNAADLVISRCGAMTLSEIAAVGVPSILIPSPNVADDHQLKNAKNFALDGCAMLIEESNLNLRTLLDGVRELHHNTKLSENMGNAVKKKYNENAVEDILEEIYAVVKKNK